VQPQSVVAGDGAVAGWAMGAAVAVLLKADVTVQEVKAGQHYAVPLDLQRSQAGRERSGISPELWAALRCVTGTQPAQLSVPMPQSSQRDACTQTQTQTQAQSSATGMP
jgi:hypothetical protein